MSIAMAGIGVGGTILARLLLHSLNTTAGATLIRSWR